MASLTAPVTVEPRVSILVPAWNERHNIDAFIQSYVALTYPHRELILSAGGSDGTYERAISYAGDSIVVLRQEPGEGKQRSLRKGFVLAIGDIIVLTDADCILNQDSLDRLLHPIISGNSAVTTGVSRPKSSQMSHPFVYYQYVALRQRDSSHPRGHDVKTLLGRNCAILRTALADVGGFDEDIAVGTDSFLGKKLVSRGHRIHLVDDSIVETEFPTSLRDYVRQRSRWGRNAILHNMRFRLYRRVAKAIAARVSGLAMLLLPIFSFRFGRAILGFWIVGVAWAYFTRVRNLRSAGCSHATISASLNWRIPVYLFAEWMAQGLALIQLLLPRTRHLW